MRKADPGVFARDDASLTLDAGWKGARAVSVYFGSRLR
jgi:hypothetical protein